jgi:hypothetical protein
MGSAAGAGVVGVGAAGVGAAGVGAAGVGAAGVGAAGASSLAQPTANGMAINAARQMAPTSLINPFPFTHSLSFLSKFTKPFLFNYLFVLSHLSPPYITEFKYKKDSTEPYLKIP